MLQINNNGDLNDLTYIRDGQTKNPGIVYLKDGESNPVIIWAKLEAVYIKFDIIVESVEIYVDVESIIDLGDGTKVTLNPGFNTVVPVASPIFLESDLGLTHFKLRGDSFLHIDVINSGTLTSLANLCFDQEGMDEFSITKLISFTMINGERLLSMFQTFNNVTDLESVSIGNTKNVTDFNSTFSGCVNLNFPLNLSTSSGINFFEVFAYCNMEELELLDLSSAQSLSSAFMNCTKLKKVPTLIIPNVTTIHNAFGGCTSLYEVPDIDLSSVLIADSAFYGCTGILIVNDLNLAAATDLGDLFADCSNLSTVGNINAPLNTSLFGTFRNCTSLGDIADIDMPLLTSMDWVFRNTLITECPIVSSGVNLTRISEAYYNTNIMNFPHVLEDTLKISNMDGLFYNCTELKEAGIIGVESPGTMKEAFRGCSKIESIGGFKVLGASVVTTDAAGLFRDCSLLVCIGDMDDLPLHISSTQIFEGCSSLLYPDPTEQDAITAALNLLWDNPGDCPST